MVKSNRHRQSSRSGFRSICFFIAIGGVAALAHIGIAVGLIEYYNVSFLVGSLSGFFVAANISFWGHYKWTFESVARKRVAYIRFFYTAFLGFLIGNLVPIVLVDIDLINYTVAIAVANLIAPVASFIINKMWTFA